MPSLLVCLLLLRAFQVPEVAGAIIGALAVCSFLLRSMERIPTFR